MLSALLVAFAATATIAKPIQTTTIQIMVQDDRSPIKLEELPDAVKETLSSEEFAEWTPTEAFVITKKEGPKYYEVSLKKGEEVKVVNFSEDGKVIEIPVEEGEEG